MTVGHIMEQSVLPLLLLMVLGFQEGNDQYS